jgi:response regulator RpfG family c-di-GMP phosphodiesterase
LKIRLLLIEIQDMATATIKAMVIDTDVINCILIKEVLKASDIKTLEAHSIEEARCCLDCHIPDIVFLDLLLAKSSNPDFIEHIKNICPFSPLFIMTAFDEKNFRELDLPNHITGVINKPFSIAYLRTVVEQVLK